MAILKHISSKNANYGDAEKYLTFEHDEFTMKPTLDADGRLIPRVDYRISSLNCGGEDFAVACMRSNLRYGKNQKREDVKSHHYIISFDPRDGPDNGLTVGVAVIITYSPQNGVILLVMAFLISPMGLPLAAIWLLGKVQSLKFAIQDWVYG